MVSRCRCNRTGSCRGCACVKARKSCLPSKLGTCLNVSTTPTHTRLTASPDLPRTPNIPSDAYSPSVTGGPVMNVWSEIYEPTSPVTSDTPVQQPAHSNQCPPQLPAFQPMDTPVFSWGTHNADDFTHELEAAYSEVVHWRSNSFKVPTSKAGKEFVRELSYQ